MKKNRFVIKPDLALKDNIPVDILVHYLEAFDIVKKYYVRNYRTEYEDFIYKLNRDFIIWVQTYYGVK